MMNHKTTILHILLLTLFVSSVMGREAAPAKGKHQVRKESFGKTGDGRPVDLFTLTNSKGLELRTINYGGIIVSLRVPDKNGNFGPTITGIYGQSVTFPLGGLITAVISFLAVATPIEMSLRSPATSLFKVFPSSPLSGPAPSTIPTASARKIETMETRWYRKSIK